jgi:AcrR family transcriptional regulator
MAAETKAKGTGRNGQRGPKPLLGEEPRDRLCEAALACFDRKGIRRTSMDEIAREAGISRPAVYYYFSTKDDLVLEIVARQASKILRDLSRKLARARGLDAVGEAAVLGIRASLDNHYVRLLISPDAAQLTGRLLETEYILGIQRSFWFPLLERARSAGELRSDLDFGEIMEWIIFLQFTLATHGQSFAITSDDEIRRKLRAFLLPALRPVP